jgi:hypothetical protein
VPRKNLATLQTSFISSKRRGQVIESLPAKKFCRCQALSIKCEACLKNIKKRLKLSKAVKMIGRRAIRLPDGYFQTKNPNLGKFLRALGWKMLIYFMDIWNI